MNNKTFWSCLKKRKKGKKVYCANLIVKMDHNSHDIRLPIDYPLAIHLKKWIIAMEMKSNILVMNSLIGKEINIYIHIHDGILKNSLKMIANMSAGFFQPIFST